MTTTQPQTDGLTTSTVTLDNLDELKELLSHGQDDDARQTHADALLPETSGDNPVAAIAAYVVGNAPLDDAVQQAAQAVFPMQLQVTEAPGPITVTGKKDLSTTDGTPSIVKFTDVTLADGGYFYCESTTLFFTCNTLTRQGSSSGSGDFVIVGSVGSTPAKPSTPGPAGQAQSGAPGQCSSVGIAGDGGGNGANGAKGANGTDGGTGHNGTASQAATIVISQALTADQLLVYTMSGSGGKGGDGGDGAKGQQGGNGGNGVSCDCTGNGGGTGGAGGPGGDGGRAGDGGNGVDAASNIVVKVPTNADIKKVQGISVSSPYGQPGSFGNHANGGDGGGASSGGKNNSGGSAGGGGGTGKIGASGNPGTVQGKPATVTAILV